MRCRPSHGSVSAIRASAATMALRTATRARSSVDPLVRRRPASPVAAPSWSSSHARSSSSRSTPPAGRGRRAGPRRRAARDRAARPPRRPPVRRPGCRGPGSLSNRCRCARPRIRGSTNVAPSRPTSQRPPGCSCRCTTRSPVGCGSVPQCARSDDRATRQRRSGRRSRAPRPGAGRRLGVAEQGEAAGQGVVGDAVPHHRAGVDHRTTGVRREQGDDRGAPPRGRRPPRAPSSTHCRVSSQSVSRGSAASTSGREEADHLRAPCRAGRRRAR